MERGLTKQERLEYQLKYSEMRKGKKVFIVKWQTTVSSQFNSFLLSFWNHVIHGIIKGLCEWLNADFNPFNFHSFLLFLLLQTESLTGHRVMATATADAI